MSKFNFTDYQLGDVLVVYSTSFRGRLISRASYRGTGLWSHVGIVALKNSASGYIDVIEATDEGVVITPLDYFLEDRKNLAVCRCNQPFDAWKLTNDLVNAVGVPYAWGQLGLNVIALMWKFGAGREAIKHFTRNADGVTCSELAAQVYAYQGILVKDPNKDGIYIPPPYIAPNEFIDSFAFEVVYLSNKEMR